MKKLAIFAMMLGCSSEPSTDTGNYPPDSGTESTSSSPSSSSSSSSGMNCMPILWSYGKDRFCEQCTCPGTECRTHALGEDLFVGICDEKLNCSAKCNDPLWLETHNGGQ
jgi:hypothetical protein